MRHGREHLRCLLYCILSSTIVFAGCSANNDDSVPLGLTVRGSAVKDFGECFQGDELAYTFTLASTEEIPIRIVGLKSSCTCTWTEDEASCVGSIIRPGGELQVRPHLEARDAQEAISGRVAIHWQSADSREGQVSQGTVRLTLKATVIPDYRVEPRHVDFGEVDGLQVSSVSQVVQITPEATKAVTINAVKASGNGVSAQLVTPEDGQHKSDHRVQILLDVSSLSASSHCGGTVVLETDNDALPRALIRVEADYISPVDVVPQAIIIGSDEHGDTERTLRITSSCPSRVDLANRNSDSVRLDLDATQLAREHLVKIGVANCESEPLNTTIDFRIELHMDSGRTQLRTLSVPAYRFVYHGVQP